MKKYSAKPLGFVSAAIGVAILGFGSAALADKPEVIPVTTFNVGSNVYAELTAIGNAISEKFGTKIRAIPVGNAVGRAIALKTGKAEFWASCSAYYTTFEGIGDFAAKKWGPQPLRMLILANRDNNFSPAVSKDSPVNSIADLKGKRVGWVVGNSGINMQTQAYLAYGGLTLDDVELVEFPGYSPSVRGLISGQADMVLAANSSPVTMQVASSPAGLKWIPVPQANSDGWNKLQKMAPFVGPTTITRGPGVEDGQSVEVGGYPCPSFATTAQLDPETVYWLTKMIVESWDGYSDAIASAPFWKIDTAIKSRFAVPYHEGAIRYYKEVDLWSADLEAQQQALVERERVMQAAFEKAKADFKGDDEAFPAHWEKEKLNAFKAAGL